MTKMTVEKLEAFADAWARRDAFGVMAHFADECQFFGSTGPGPGSDFRGRAAVHDAVSQALVGMVGEFKPGSSYIVGDRGFSEWTMVTVAADGSKIKTRGIDLFDFEGDRILVKDAFRKVRS
jgi:ketosteroid isomerase-like protein